MKSFNLSKAVKVNSQFGRSVNLERDFYSDVSLDSYILTTTALRSLDRIGKAILDGSSSRAWTLTGPFGSGKSAFAFYVARLLDPSQRGNSEVVEKLRQSLQAGTSFGSIVSNDSSSARFLPILVSGAREPLAGAILRGIRSAIMQLDGKARRVSLAALNKLEESRHVTGKGILSVLHSISRSVDTSATELGVLLVIDELGKLLEFAGSNQAESDIFLLQELAEGTKRGSRSVLLLTILHQAFERYAERLGERERGEWAKVQGRFEDIAFQEPFEQTLLVLGTVFTVDSQSAPASFFRKVGTPLATKAYDLGLCGRLSKADAIPLLRDCIPLHPLVAFLLGTIFRKFGQNERSLFAFLTSGEPYGFVDFLSRTDWTDDSQELIRLDNIYDYLVSALGSALMSGIDGRKWAEVESALLRVPDASELETRILKNIGLFYLLGDLGRFKASRELLHFSLHDSQIGEKEIDEGLERLKRNAVITERRFNDTFAIWEGSDVDLDERFSEAARIINKDASLAENLKLHFTQRPIVAKRHSARTGTLRYFEIAYINADEPDLTDVSVLQNADAQIVFVLATSKKERTAFEAKLTKGVITAEPHTILAVPKDLEGLREGLWRVICWRWVLANTPQLETDRAARKELIARLSYSEQEVANWLDDWRGSGASSACFWYRRGSRMEFDGPRSLQESLSRVMDDLFPETPILKNELVNRNVLSGAAASARKSLLEGMLLNADQAQLGISGFPPQLSIYFSVFQETTVHREENGAFGFFPPIELADKGIRSVWTHIIEFLKRTERQKLTVGDLFDDLKRPPFGLKRGVLPLLATAVFLHYDSEVALYERGNFIPSLSMPVLERMCRTPESFSVQLCSISGVRSEVLVKIAGILLPDEAADRPVDILTVVRPLARFAQELVDYSQHTSKISPLARNVRRVLFSAREPAKMLFELLPQACGVEPFSASKTENGKNASVFTRRLHRALTELKRTYSDLLNEIELLVTNAFSLQELESREKLRIRCQALAGFAASVKLKGFILRASDLKLERNEWLESIGAQLAGKPPAFWRDQDLANFELNLMETVRSFTNLESLIFERLSGSLHEDESELIRINLAQQDGVEHSRVLSVQPAEREMMNEATRLLRDAFNRSPINGNRNLRLATLAHLSLELLEESD